MKTFSVKNFTRFQHYKDRSPPWIKLYNELLDDYEFGRLQDASKLHLIAIWLLASRLDNQIPYDPKWIAKRINATERVDLDGLQAAGFIIILEAEQDASITLADCKQSACLERETEKSRDRVEGETEPERADARPTAKATRLPDDWLPGEPLVRWCGTDLPGFDWQRETEVFRDYWKAAPGAKGRKQDWPAVWRNWMRRAAEGFGKTNGANGHGQNRRQNGADSSHQLRAGIAAAFPDLAGKPPADGSGRTRG